MIRSTRNAMLFFSLLFWGLPACAQSTLPVRVGMLSSLDAWFFVETFSPSITHLRKDLPDLTFICREYDHEDLLGAVDRKEVDVIITPSGMYAFLETTKGAQQMVTRRNPYASSAARSAGSTVIARRKDVRIRTLGDLRGKRVATEDEHSLTGWLALLGEIQKVDSRPRAFFGTVVVTRYLQPDPLVLLLSGQVDAAVIGTCELEKRILRGGLSRDRLNVVNPRRHEGFACEASTDLYPDIVVSSLPGMPTEAVERITLSLLTMPRTSKTGRLWGLSNRFAEVRSLYRDLRAGPYEPLGSLTLDTLLDANRRWLLSALLGFAALVFFVGFHIIRSNRLVRERTRDLRKALDENIRLYEKVQKAQEKASQLERLGIISFMSSMLVHEIQQPTTALINFSKALSQLVQRKDAKDPRISLAAERIGREAFRIASIVDRVRTYAKGKTRDTRPEFPTGFYSQGR